MDFTAQRLRPMTEAGKIRLTAGRLAADLDSGGAIITGFHWRPDNGNLVSLMRNGASHGGNPLKSSCFPLVPFGNRVRDNCFSFDGHIYRFKANQSWDRHYLHGDGWLSQWSVQRLTERSVALAMSHEAGPASPYVYAATADMRSARRASRSVCLSPTRENCHCHSALACILIVPLRPRPLYLLPPRHSVRKLRSSFPGRADQYQTNSTSAASVLPHRWIDNGFAGWNGCAEIRWPERGLALRTLGDAAFRNYFLFMSDRRFEPDFAGDYFCFEPMTHAANARNIAGLAGLAVLAPGQTLRACVSFEPHEIPTPSGTIR